eukprot:1158312-Pelagomonas_calceolata.AAC.4
MVLAEKTCLWRLMCTCPRKLLNKSGICFSFNNPVEVLVEGPTLRVCKAVIHSSVQPLPCASAEVPLCGHATLAAAAVLIGRDEGKRDISTRKGVHFKTASGMLSVEKSDHDAKPECGVSPHFTMRLPLAPPSTTLPPPFLQRPAQETNAGAEFAICSQPAAVQAFLQACVGEGFKMGIPEDPVTGHMLSIE